MTAPLFIRTISQRASDKIEGEPDEVVIAISPADPVPILGHAYSVEPMGDLLVMGIWPAGETPNNLNELTHDAPGGYTIIRLRVPPLARQGEDTPRG